MIDALALPFADVDLLARLLDSLACQIILDEQEASIAKFAVREEFIGLVEFRY